MNVDTASTIDSRTTVDSAAILEAVFNPASVALIGASNSPSKLITYRPIDYMKRYGFQGNIFPINPKYDAIQDLPAYGSILDVPETPELAIIALPRQHVVRALEECVTAGTKVAIVYSSGFTEVEDGKAYQDSITEMSLRTGLRVIGPNCQGIANISTGFFPCFSTTFADGAPKCGRTAIISQSGAVAGMLYNNWVAVGGGAKYWASTGNESDLTVAQLALAVIEDSEIDQILLYLESVRDADLLELLAQRAAELGKHVIAHRPARTERGWKAAGRHTGAGSDPADKLENQLPSGPGFLEVGSLSDMISLAQIVRAGKTMSGNKVGVISNSGGLGVMTADVALRSGFELDGLSETNQEALAQILPGFASVLNPIDVTAQLLNEPDLLSKALPAMFGDDQMDAILVSLAAVGDGYDVGQLVADITGAHAESTKPIVVIWVGSKVDVRAKLGSVGVPTFDNVESAVAALAAFSVSSSTLESPSNEGPHAPSFSELFVGAEYISDPITVTREDVDAYAVAAHQSTDGKNVHADLRAALAGGHPGRVVSGLHTLTQITILGERMQLWTNSLVVAGFDLVRFKKPVYEGDTIGLRLKVNRMKPLRRPGSGIVSFGFEIESFSGSGSETCASGEVSYVFGPNGADPQP